MESIRLMDEATAAGMTIHLDGESLVVRGPRSAERLAKEQLSRKSEIIRLLHSGDGNTNRSNPAKTRIVSPPQLEQATKVGGASIHWPAALADFVLLLVPGDLPAPPFLITPAVQIVSRERFLNWLKADIYRGPTGPRARWGALQSDLQRLRDLLLNPPPMESQP